MEGGDHELVVTILLFELHHIIYFSNTCWKIRRIWVVFFICQRLTIILFPSWFVYKTALYMYNFLNYLKMELMQWNLGYDQKRPFHEGEKVGKSDAIDIILFSSNGNILEFFGNKSWSIRYLHNLKLGILLNYKLEN